MSIRHAVPSDASAIALVHVQSWQSGYRDYFPAEFLGALDPSQKALAWSEILSQSDLDIFVSERDGGISGFTVLAPSRDSVASPETGEIQSIYVLPEHWRCGIGRELVRTVLSRALERRFDKVTLWVLEANIGARSFYEQSGFTLDGAKKTERLTSQVDLKQVRYCLDLSGVSGRADR